MTGARHRFGPCARPLLAAYESSAGQYAVHVIPANALDAGETRSLGSILTARIATVGGASWIAYADDGGGHLVGLLGPELVVKPFPNLGGPFDITPSRVFWLDGTMLATGTPCLR